MVPVPSVIVPVVPAPKDEAPANDTAFAPNVKVPVPVAIVFPFKVAAVKVEVFNTLELMVSAVTVPFNPLTRNLAEAVEFPPIANASNESSGDIRLELFWKKLIDPEALDQVGTPPTIVKILPFDPPAD